MLHGETCDDHEMDNDGWRDDRDTCIAWHNDLVICVSELDKGMIRSSRYRLGM